MEGRDLFTPQQLFGEVESSADVLTHAPFLERARGEHERDRELSARLALGAYLVSRLVDRMLMRDDSTGAQEGMLWQLDAVRRHLRELPADSPESAHLHGITDAIPVGAQSLASLRLSLMAYAYFLEHEGRLEEALEVLALAVRTHGPGVPAADFAASALFAGRLNRLLARWHDATTCYSAAESAAPRPRGQGAGAAGPAWRGAVHPRAGQPAVAEQIAEAVAAGADRAALREVEAMAYADLGAVLLVEGRRVEAIQANYRLFLLSDDTLQRMRVLGDLGRGPAEIGAHDAARWRSTSWPSPRRASCVRLNAVLELMELESAVGNRMAFERRRARARRRATRMPPSMLADFYFKAGVGLARFGQFVRARDLLGRACALAENHRLNAWYFRFEQTIANLAGCETREPELHPRAGTSSAVREVAVGLREYALQPT